MGFRLKSSELIKYDQDAKFLATIVVKLSWKFEGYMKSWNMWIKHPGYKNHGFIRLCTTLNQLKYDVKLIPARHWLHCLPVKWFTVEDYEHCKNCPGQLDLSPLSLDRQLELLHVKASTSIPDHYLSVLFKHQSLPSQFATLADCC